jgi:hypothetical protein
MRFRAYATRKAAEASSAHLQAFATEFDRAAGALAPIGNGWSRRFFDGNFCASPSPDSTHPACSLVFVQSRDGNTGARDPSTLGGGETNKDVIYEGLSQMAADAGPVWRRDNSR